MAYLAHTAHTQLCSLWVGCVGWTFTAVALGLIQWRVWLVSDREVINSGVAWVGIWRACFNSHTVVSPGLKTMHCGSISLTEDFTPPEIVAGQVLMMLSLIVGLCGNAGAVYALRNIHLGRENRPIHLAFLVAGGLCLLAAAMSLIPLLWNMSSVLTNQTITFPQDFLFPSAPESQRVGGGIQLGIVGTVMMIITGIIFCTYRLPVRSQLSAQQALQIQVGCSSPAGPGTAGCGLSMSIRGIDNHAFESHDL